MNTYSHNILEESFLVPPCHQLSCLTESLNYINLVKKLKSCQI